MRLLWLSLTVMALAAAPLAAQEAGSRTEAEARRQEEKAKALTEYRRAWLEKQLLEIEKAGGFNAAHGLFVTVGGIKAGSGIAVGPAYAKMLDSGAVFTAKAVYSVKQFKLAQVAMQSGPLAGGRLTAQGRVRWQDAPAVAFYGLGTNAAPVRADYSETRGEVSGLGVFRPVPALRFAAGAGLEKYETGPGEAKRPSIGELFTAVPGVNADATYLHSSASAGVDSRDGEGYSRHGTLLRATFHDYHQTDEGAYSFRRVDGAVEQYLPILHGNWVIYLGARASTTSTSSGNSVPFFLLPDVGGNDLRGYNSFRFRDRHSVVFTAEYRWYAQENLDAAIFYDAGKVVANRSDLNFKDLRGSVGGGLRLHGPRTTAVRVELAHSREGLRFILSFSPVGG